MSNSGGGGGGDSGGCGGRVVVKCHLQCCPSVCNCVNSIGALTRAYMLRVYERLPPRSSSAGGYFRVRLFTGNNKLREQLGVNSSSLFSYERFRANQVRWLHAAGSI